MRRSRGLTASLADLLTPPEGVAAATAHSAMAQGIMHADRINTVSEHLRAGDHDAGVRRRAR